MLFNSYEFLFFFLPGVFAVHRCLIRRGISLTFILGWLCLASLLFYAWWRPAYLVLLASSIGTNFIAAQSLKTLTAPTGRKLALLLGVVFNLSLLAYFKYTGFILLNLQLAGFLASPAPDIILPLAISFFTFQQIAYLVTCYRDPGSTCSLLEHVFFITFFPHLIAGPIVYKNELVDQVRAGKLGSATPLHYQLGLSLFIIGLAKKLLIGDNLALLVNPLYDQGGPASSFDAWFGSILFGLQIYFDFSAYSDMALGVAYLFGLTLPINFDSPYKSTHYREFWRRWHVTLFRFFRDHVYIPLSRQPQGLLYKTLLTGLVFFLSGLWHGAAWTFVAWGVINWLLILANDAWLYLWSRMPVSIPQWISQVLGRLYVFVAMSWTFMLFRSPDFATAQTFLTHAFTPWHATDSRILAAAKQHPWLDLGNVADVPLSVGLGVLTLGLAALVWHAPCAVRYTLRDAYPGETATLPSTRTMAILLGLLAWASIMAIPRSTQFLYFQF